MVKTDISYGPLPEQKLDVYLSDGESGRSPLFIYFHGGGLEAGNKGNGGVEAFSELAGRGISVVSADYRMYPGARFPDFVSDAAECAAWCRNNLTSGEIYIGGSSAGAFLTMMLAFDPK